jgi:hypothetical protein
MHVGAWGRVMCPLNVSAGNPKALSVHFSGRCRPSSGKGTIRAATLIAHGEYVKNWT